MCYLVLPPLCCPYRRVVDDRVYGDTDDFRYSAADRPMHVNDLHAALLKCLGIDHERFTVKFQGLDQRLTGDESPKVMRERLVGSIWLTWPRTR